MRICALEVMLLSVYSVSGCLLAVICSKYVQTARVIFLWSVKHQQGSRVEYTCRESPSLKMGPIGCPETSVINYHYWPRNIPEERSSHLLRGRSLKLRMPILSVNMCNNIRNNRRVEKIT